MEAVLVVGGIAALCIGLMVWYARRAAKRDPVDADVLSETDFPGGHAGP